MSVFVMMVVSSLLYTPSWEKNTPAILSNFLIDINNNNYLSKNIPIEEQMLSIDSATISYFQ